MTPLDFRSDGHIHAHPFNRRVYRFQDEQDVSNPGRPITVTATSCPVCIHGETHYGCGPACPRYGTDAGEMASSHEEIPEAVGELQEARA